MTEELIRFNELLEGISITDELPDNILELKLTDLLCKHVFNSSDKAFKLLMASIRVGYDYCQWNVANTHFLKIFFIGVTICTQPSNTSGNTEKMLD